MSNPAGVIAAVLQRRGRFLVATPLFGGEPVRGRSQLTVDTRGTGAKEGALVLVSSQRGKARIAELLGRPDVAADVITALMAERGLRRRFDPAVEREAREAARRAPPTSGRRDLRHLATLTIDPASARDYDDAISAERLTDDIVRVHVHIADVAAFVTPGSLTDREAHRRATSVYVPGAVEPMLPAALSSEACSLVAHQDRLTVSVELDFRGAEVVRAEFARSVIRSDARLSYEQIDQVFAGGAQAQKPWAEPLALAREVARALAVARERRGGLEIASGEAEFVFDRHGHVAELHRAEQTESHRLIEHLMIAANEQVATLLSKRGLPALYRVHEQPDPRRVERLLEQLASLQVPTPPLPAALSPSQAGELVGECSQLAARYAAQTGRGARAYATLILRSLQQAYYSPRNLGHAGLRSLCYCHFTSPIRRYPDLVCHRALIAAIGGADETAPAGSLVELGEWTSLRERDAMDIERSADDVARCFALQRESRDRVWDGEVVGLIPGGAFVDFGDGYDGLLPVRRIRAAEGEREWWELNEEGTILNGSGGSLVRLGDPVKVRVGRIDAPRGRIDLELADRPRSTGRTQVPGRRSVRHGRRR